MQYVFCTCLLDLLVGLTWSKITLQIFFFFIFVNYPAVNSGGVSSVAVAVGVSDM